MIDEHRFVDRDMFMRFRGGGIGHHGMEVSEQSHSLHRGEDSDDEELDIPNNNSDHDSEQDDELEVDSDNDDRDSEDILDNIAEEMADEDENTNSEDGEDDLWLDEVEVLGYAPL